MCKVGDIVVCTKPMSKTFVVRSASTTYLITKVINKTKIMLPLDSDGNACGGYIIATESEFKRVSN